MYELTHQNEIQTFEDRSEAVQTAKELTSAVDGRSMVNITDGIETLSYRDGKLVAYTYETRRSDSRFDGPRDDDRSNANQQTGAASPKAEAAPPKAEAAPPKAEAPEATSSDE
ncbi:MAG TPA: hypothetical protein EYN06_06825 [Myxococcales bacterium]|nr:hypothetical protein [Myxococcales bacterium]HIN86177.1 hypothetical protein [Myxococcales bacterium]